ncbi:MULTISPECIES: hypothetical protein [Cohnella]|uniref:hypothetical protein n=1 Tax=Cohnella TaxID=329857 RepID=UPI0004275491|nr:MULTISPECIES: hypothetical protein [Cohnella]
MANELFMRNGELRPEHPETELFPDFYVAQHAEKFLDCIEKIAPDVVSDLLALEDDFRSALKKCKGIATLYHAIMNPCSTSEEEIGKLRNHIYEWAKKYNLIDHELHCRQYIRVGFLFLRDFIDHGECSLSDCVDYPNDSEFNFGTLFPIRFIPKPEMLVYKSMQLNKTMKKQVYENKIADIKNFESDLDSELSRSTTIGCGWDPRKMPREKFRDIITGLFEDYLKMSLDRTEQFIKKHGFTASTGERQNNHTEWLVRYQILNEDYNKIADFYNSTDISGKLINKPLSPSAVRKGILKMAQLLNLHLREYSK